MKQYSDLDVYGKIKQKVSQGTENEDVVLYPTLTERVPSKLPAPAGNSGKAIMSNGTGYVFGDPGLVDDVQINGTTIVSSQVANIPIASSSALGVVKVNGGGIKITDGVLGHTNSITANTTGVGSASKVPVFKYDANGHITAVTPTDIAIAGEKITSGTVASARLPTATTSAIGGVTLVQGTNNDSTTSVPTDKRMQQYVATQIDALPEPMLFKGTVGTGGTITTLPAAAAANEGFTYKAITAHAASTDPIYPAYEIGDTLISTGSAWTVIPSGDEPRGTVTTVTPGTGLTTTGLNPGSNGDAITGSGTISLANTAVTPGSYGDDGNTRTLAYGGTLKVPYYTVDAQGRLTASSTKSLTLPASDNTIGKLIIGAATTAKADATTTNTTTFLNHIENNAVQSHHQIKGAGATTVAFDTSNGLIITSTDQSVDSSAHHYTPATVSGNDKTASASGGSASWNTSVVSGITVNTDGKGHITGLSVSSVKTPADPGHYTTNLIANTANNSKANATAAITNGNLFLNLVENNTVRNSHKIVGAGLVEVTRGASDNTISISDKFAVTDVTITES